MGAYLGMLTAALRDRDRSYGSDFIARARSIGIETVLTPIRTPQANGVAERLIGTLRRECVDHIIPLPRAPYIEALKAGAPHVNVSGI